MTVTLEPHGDTDTLMTIHHAQLPPKHVENHQRGWAAIAEQLGSVLKLRSPAPPPQRREGQ